MSTKFGPYATIIMVIIGLFVIVSILSTAVPSIMHMADKIRERAAITETFEKVPMH